MFEFQSIQQQISIRRTRSENFSIFSATNFFALTESAESLLAKAIEEGTLTSFEQLIDFLENISKDKWESIPLEKLFKFKGEEAKKLLWTFFCFLWFRMPTWRSQQSKMDSDKIASENKEEKVDKREQLEKKGGNTYIVKLLTYGKIYLECCIQKRGQDEQEKEPLNNSHHFDLFKAFVRRESGCSIEALMTTDKIHFFLNLAMNYVKEADKEEKRLGGKYLSLDSGRVVEREVFIHLFKYRTFENLFKEHLLRYLYLLHIDNTNVHCDIQKESNSIVRNFFRISNTKSEINEHQNTLIEEEIEADKRRSLDQVVSLLPFN